MTAQSFVGPIIHCNKQRELVIHDNAQIDVKNGKVYFSTISVNLMSKTSNNI